MLLATVLALSAAVMHVAWNLAVKQASGDRLIVMWGQFTVAAIAFAPLLVVFGGVPAGAWRWAAMSGIAHVPYCWCLARAYDIGDFSLVYPVARGGGAVLAALGGVLFLGDVVTVLAGIAIVVVGFGLMALAGAGSQTGFMLAVGVALSIGTYSVIDAQGIRSSGTWLYAVATKIGGAMAMTVFIVARGQLPAAASAMRADWRRMGWIGIVSGLTYLIVVLAFRYAPVGYVTALRESSVVLAAWVGWRFLGERAGRRRLVASLVVVAGLIGLVTSA